MERSYKTQFPALPEHFIRRSHIYSILEEDSGVFFLNGKKGCGKTSVVSGYCKEFANDGSVFWYSFEKEDNDEQYFREHFLASFESVDEDTDFFEIMEYVAGSDCSVLVFDNLQLLSNKNILQSILLLLEMECGKKIILIMSESPASCFSRYLAAGNYRQITEQELYFSEGELKQLAEYYFSNSSCDEACVLKIQELSDGWPVAAVSIPRHYAKSGGTLSELKTKRQSDVFMDTMLYDFIEYEIFSKFSVKERLFLARTAVLHELDVALCHFCTGEDYTADMLRKFRRKYLIDGDGYFPLFRKFLLEQTTERQKQELRTKARNYYLQKKKFKEAFFYMEEDAARVYPEVELAEARPKKERKIKVNTFGTFRAVFLEDGKELSWRTKKGCELFAYLVHLNGNSVERKTLLAELWHEKIPDNAVAMLHNMFYNIRKELSCYHLESMIAYKDKKYVMDISVIESDLDRIQEVAEYVERKDMGRLFENCHLFDRYWGRYLEDMDSEWVRDQQEYYDKIYVKGCQMLADCFMEKEMYEEAILYLKNIRMLDNYSETVMALLLKCYYYMGDFNNIRKQYSEFCLLLKQDFGIQPGEELQNSYRDFF